MKWPSGLVEEYTDLPTNVTVNLKEGDNLEILDILPSQKIYGCTDPFSCNYNPNATINDDSCIYLQSQTIIGNTNSSFLATETYTYITAPDSIATWQVLGGEIVSGQGTNTVQIKWNIEALGQINVTESDGQCSSLETSIEVNLSAENLSEHISIARLWNEALLEAIRNMFR